MKPVLVAMLLTACGRMGFDAGGTADAGGNLIDGPPHSDLLLHFTFDDGDLLTDRAQAPHHASCASCPTATAGIVGNGAALFDSSQCLELLGSRELQPDVFTFSAWARATLPHASTVFGRALDGSTTFDNTFEIWVDETPSWNVSVEGARVVGGGDSGVWHHYAGTYDGGQLSAYRDGVRIERNPAGITRYTADDLTIGCDLNLGALNQRFDGALDDIRLYDRVLSDPEISLLAQP
ncbi:MAG: hypothetical protein JWP01_3225 [Myxococcales bacterium]|nr:hypothetical protein [Myxococcales bacterium]